MLHSMGDLNRILRQFVLTRESVEFRFADQQLFSSFYTQMDQLIDDYNAAAEWEDQFYGAYRVWASPEQNGIQMMWTD